VNPDEVGAVSNGERMYRDADGSTFNLHLILTKTDTGAYALLTRFADGKDSVRVGVVGVAAISTSGGIIFCKGANLVEISGADKPPARPDQLLKIARAFAATLASGDDDIPVLVEHLPNWQAAAPKSVYAVTLDGLKKTVTGQKALDALNFDGGAEAVTANYGQSQLVIVEFTTPQFSIENDKRIVAKIQELKIQNQPVPTAYRRVGNYSVFVFNAPDEKAANQLIDQVKYEQVVQWLGDNPHWYERAQNYLLRTTGGVLIAVVEASIVSLLVCLALGSLIGTMLFRRRRAQQQAASVYSDAGGAVRLNLDELTANRNRHRLLESGKESQSE